MGRFLEIGFLELDSDEEVWAVGLLFILFISVKMESLMDFHPRRLLHFNWFWVVLFLLGVWEYKMGYSSSSSSSLSLSLLCLCWVGGIVYEDIIELLLLFFRCFFFLNWFLVASFLYLM